MTIGWRSALFLLLVCSACGPIGDTYSGVLSRTRTCPGQAPVTEQYQDTVALTMRGNAWSVEDPVCPQMMATSKSDTATVTETQCAPTELFGSEGQMTFTDGAWVWNDPELDVSLTGTVTFDDGSGNPVMCGLSVEGALISDSATAAASNSSLYCP